MGQLSALAQDFKSLVGITSKEQVESLEILIRLRISSTVAGSNSDRTGGSLQQESSGKGQLMFSGIEEQSLTILSLKKFKNQVARTDADSAFGRILGRLRPKRELTACHIFLGEF